jgi:hypothetical protein
MADTSLTIEDCVQVALEKIISRPCPAIPYNDSIPAPTLNHALAEEGRRLVERMRGIR